MKIAALVLALLCGSAFGAGPTVHFENGSLSQFAYVLFSEVLRVQYVIDSSIKNEVVTAHVYFSDDPAQRQAQVLPLMESLGVSVTQQAGVFLLSAAKPKSDDDGFVYRPRWRSVTYLVDLVSPLFKPTAFAVRRGVQSLGQGQAGITSNTSPGSAPGVGQSSTSPGLPGAPGSAAIDSPGSALSFQDRGPDVLVFKGDEKEIARLQKLLAQLDTATPEVLVKAVVYEVTTGEDKRSAMSIAASILGGKLGLKAGTATAGDYSAMFKSSSVQVIFDALNSDNRFKVVTNPTLRVRSGGSARLLVGNQTPVVGAIQVSNGTTTQSVDYKPSGVILDIKPEIREEVAELQLTQQISNFVVTTSGVNQSPTLVTREVTTSVGVRGDEVLVLGGLDQSQVSDTGAGLSFLPAWLKAKTSSDQKTEILLVLQAQRI